MSMIARLWRPQAGQVFGDGSGSEFSAVVCGSWIVDDGIEAKRHKPADPRFVPVMAAREGVLV